MIAAEFPLALSSRELVALRRQISERRHAQIEAEDAARHARWLRANGHQAGTARPSFIEAFRKRNGRATRQEAAILAGVSVSTAKRITNQLVAEGLLAATGVTRGGSAEYEMLR